MPRSRDHAMPGGLRAGLVVSLVAAALLPLVTFGGMALLQVDAAVSTSLSSQIRVALGGASGLIERAYADLAETTTSYATWPDLQDAVATGKLDVLDVDVVEFLVALGEVDAVTVASATEAVAGGDREAAGAVETIARLAAGAAPIAIDVGPRLMGLSSGVYLVAAVPVVVDGRTIGSIAMARRLDAATVVAIAQTTGFDVAVASQGSDTLVATDSGLAGLVEAARPEGADDADVQISDGLAIGRRTLRDAGGRSIGSMTVVKSLDALDVVAANLVALVAGTLLVAALGAIALAWTLGLQLRRRSETVAGWLEAVGAGMVPRGASTGAGDILPVSRAVEDLATVLNRRQARLQASLDAISQLSPRLGPRAVAEAGALAARGIFELDDVTLSTSRDTPIRQPGEPIVAAALDIPVSAADAVVPGVPDPAVLVARAAATADWEEPDRAIFALHARLLGIAVRDAILVEEAARRADELDRVAAMQSTFLRGVSHNLRQPLTTIRLAADDLATGADGERTRGTADTIRAESIRLARLVDQLLTMSRLEAGTLPIDVEPIAPAAIVRHAWESLRTTRRLSIDHRAPGVLAIADRSSVEQILTILLDNAITYAPRGPISVRIDPRRATARADDPDDPPVDPRVAGSVTITVSDTGPGVPVAERERIFERFTRGSTSARSDGIGLGLDVARGLARAMGGDVAYLERPVGAAFALLLPAEPDLGPA